MCSHPKLLISSYYGTRYSSLVWALVSRANVSPEHGTSLPHELSLSSVRTKSKATEQAQQWQLRITTCGQSWQWAAGMQNHAWLPSPNSEAISIIKALGAAMNKNVDRSVIRSATPVIRP
ncbi:hypothetical protein ACLOJK_037649 [Asimina triloba]